MRLVVAGATGRMGRRVLALASAEGEQAVAPIVGAICAPNDPACGQTLGAAGLLPIGDPSAAVVLRPRLADLDVEPASEARPDGSGADRDPVVVIDFTLPEALPALVAACVERRWPLVSGTTGLGPQEFARLEAAAATIPILHATNFSLGVAWLTRLVRESAAALGPEFEIELVEAHHNRKVDAPSGTAETLYAAVLDGRELEADAAEPARVDGRSGAAGPRQPDEIGVHAIRGGSVIGDHTVHFLGPDERLELTHRAGSRDLFVRGALRAAAWIARQPPGKYQVVDVLG